MGKSYRIGTRTSPLALKQVEEVLVSLKQFYLDFKAEVIGIDTWGDKDKNTPISEVEGSDFFTMEIDQALIRGEVDFAVHSAKDLADVLPEKLEIAGMTKSLDGFDALVSKDNLQLDNLKLGARIGISSLRRKTQLKAYRGDFQVVDIRGTIGERLSLLDNNYSLDAIIVAACALTRLGLEHKITQRIPLDILRPHPLQGALAVVIRKEDKNMLKLLKVLDVR